MDITGASMGNVQMTDASARNLRIAAQRGFQADFLKTFAIVRPDDGSACGRSMKERSTIVLEDVRQDANFAPYIDVAERAGFRAVQSTPLIAMSGALIGVLSTHFRNDIDPPRVSCSSCGTLAHWAQARSSAPALHDGTWISNPAKRQARTSRSCFRCRTADGERKFPTSLAAKRKRQHLTLP